MLHLRKAEPALCSATYLLLCCLGQVAFLSVAYSGIGSQYRVVQRNSHVLIRYMAVSWAAPACRVSFHDCLSAYPCLFFAYLAIRHVLSALCATMCWANRLHSVTLTSTNSVLPVDYKSVCYIFVSVHVEIRDSIVN